jgi:ABC-type branched-subunit amino acid transport system permease subunit
VNLLVGHHGVFSLTPFTLLTVGGLVIGLRRRRPTTGPEAPEPEAPPLPYFLFPLTAALSVVVVGFYVVSSDNYGGWSNGPRWLMWLTPLWLLTMTPAVDRLARRRWGRALAGALLVLSVLSVSYAPWNPWRHPWLYNWLDSKGLVPY